MAESVCINENNRKEFEALLNQALAVDVDKAPEQRLANMIMQRRARWLLSRIDDARYEDLSIGSRVHLKVVDHGDGRVLYRFSPKTQAPS